MASVKHEITHPKKRAAIEGMARLGTISGAAKCAEVERGTVYDWIAADEAFASAFNEAREAFADMLEERATERALSMSDTLMIFMLKGAKPEKYKDRVHSEQTGKDGSPIQSETKIIVEVVEKTNEIDDED